MASENRHITRIRDTEVNVRANLDLGQSAILTDQNEEWVYMNSADTRLYYMANQKYWDGAAFTYCDAEFEDVTAHGNLYTSGYVYHYGDTDTRIHFDLDTMSLMAGGLEFIYLLEDGAQDTLEINRANQDIDTIINTVVADTAFVRGSDGFIGVHTNAPAGMFHIYEGNSPGTADASADELIIESDGSTGLSILPGDAEGGNLFWDDGTYASKLNWVQGGWDFQADNDAVSYLYIGFDGVWVNSGGVAAIDFTVSWDSGVALFCQGSDGVVGVGTSTVQAWKTATYESVLSFGAAGKCAIAGDGSTLEIVTDAYYDITSNRWEHATATTGNARIAMGDGIYMYIPDGTGNPGDPLTWIEMLRLKYTSSTTSEIIINDTQTSKLTMKIRQKSDAAHPCIYLEQDDESEGCIDFLASDRGAIITNGVTNSVASVRCELNGTVYRVALFADA
jgi:hypothetical protein